MAAIEFCNVVAFAAQRARGDAVARAALTVGQGNSGILRWQLISEPQRASAGS